MYLKMKIEIVGINDAYCIAKYYFILRQLIYSVLFKYVIERLYCHSVLSETQLERNVTHTLLPLGLIYMLRQAFMHSTCLMLVILV